MIFSQYEIRFSRSDENWRSLAPGLIYREIRLTKVTLSHRSTFFQYSRNSLRISKNYSIPTSFAEFDEFMIFFFQNSKNTKVVQCPCTIFESTLMTQKIEVVLKIAKNTFFSSFFQHLKKVWKKRVFCDFKAWGRLFFFGNWFFSTKKTNFVFSTISMDWRVVWS